MSRRRLHPLDAVVFARLRARAAWVSTFQRDLTTRVDAISVEQSSGMTDTNAVHRESTLIEWETDVHGVDVVGVWRDVNGVYDEAGSVWALACFAGSDRRIADGSGPPWLWFTPPAGCVVASCGPVAPGDDQRALLQSRAQEAITAAERTHQRVAVWTRDEAGASVLPAQIAPSEEVDDVRVEAAGRGTFRHMWLDVAGQGPMGDTDRLYGLFCVAGSLR